MECRNRSAAARDSAATPPEDAAAVAAPPEQLHDAQQQQQQAGGRAATDESDLQARWDAEARTAGEASTSGRDTDGGPQQQPPPPPPPPQQQQQQQQQQNEGPRNGRARRRAARGSDADSGSGSGSGKAWAGHITARADGDQAGLVKLLRARLQRYSYTHVRSRDEGGAAAMVRAASSVSRALARYEDRLLIFQPGLPQAAPSLADVPPLQLSFRVATVPWGQLPVCDYLACRPDTDEALLADAVAAKIDREGFTQVCCSGPAEAARALVAMAEAREWLALYRVKDFSVVADWEEGEGEAGGADALPVAFTLLECKWNDMTYFKF